MRRGWAVGAVTLAGLLAAAAGQAQDEKATNPPAPGAAIPTGFRAYIVADDRYPPKVKDPKRPDDRDPRDRTKMMHDLVVEQGLNPTVAVFSRAVPDADAPLAGLIKQLDPVVTKHRGNNLGAFVVFLTLEKEFPQDESRTESGQYQREAKAQQVRALADALKTPRIVFGLAAGQSPQTATWGLADKDIVVVLYNRMQAVKTWVAPNGSPLTDEQIKDILATTDKAAAGK